MDFSGRRAGIMRTVRHALLPVFLLLTALMAAAPPPASAQHWSFDARRIALGGTRPVTSIASGMVPRRRQYRSFVLPFRLLQILRDSDVYNPHSIDFDPVRAAMNVASPLHWTFAELPPSDYSMLLNDLLDFGLDITGYFAELGIDVSELEALLASETSGAAGMPGASLPAGKHPRRLLAAAPAASAPFDTDAFRIDLQRWDWSTGYLAEFLFSNHWGRTFLVHEQPNGVTHSAYVGAGPYLSFHSDADVHAGASTYLGVESIVRSIDEGRLPPDIVGATLEFGIDNHTYSQMAATIVGGYRLRLPLPGWMPFAGREVSGRDGIYVAADYHYLHGLFHENVGTNFMLTADTADLFVTDYDPTSVSVGRIERLTSRSGRGLSLDLGAAVAVGRWDFGFGATGLMNRISWRDVRRGVLPLVENNLYEGFGAGVLDDIQSPVDTLDSSLRVSTPRRYTADVGYHRPTWSMLGNYSRGFVGNSVHAGMEYRLSWGELRYGGVFKRDRWHPTGGVGFELRPGWHLDVAAFGTSLNPQRARRLALAMSLRLE